MLSPSPGTTLAGSTMTFTWSSGTGVSVIWLDVGTTVGGAQIYGGAQAALSRSVSGLPTNGNPICVRLWSLVNAGWSFTDYVYTAAAPVLAGMISPVPGTTLAGDTETFSWTKSAGVTQIWLDIGTTVGGHQLYGATQGTAISRIVGELPTNGDAVFVRLWSLSAAGWQFTDYRYTAASVVSSRLISPAPATIVRGGAATFNWTTGRGLTQIWLDVGVTPGGVQIYGSTQPGASRTVVGIPTSGAIVYVRLWSLGGGNWTFIDYTFVTGP